MLLIKRSVWNVVAHFQHHCQTLVPEQMASVLIYSVYQQKSIHSQISVTGFSQGLYKQIEYIVQLGIAPIESRVLTCFRKLVIVFCMSATKSWKSLMEGSVLDFGETVMFTAVRASSKELKNKNH